MTNFQDLTGQRFGLLTVIERCEDKVWKDGRKRPQWLCKCDCGNYKKVPSLYLKNNHTMSCGCLRIENLKGKRFGKLKVLDFENMHIQNNGSVYSTWKCICDCGQTTIVSHGNLKSGHTISCGCMKCSMNESIIVSELNNLKINYKKEYTFDDLKSKNNIFFRFDFGLLDSDNNLLALLEYQGAQHYIDNDIGFGSGQKYYSDPLKKEYCKNKNIPLYEITYLENTKDKLYEILNKVYGNTVLSSKEKV